MRDSLNPTAADIEASIADEGKARKRPRPGERRGGHQRPADHPPLGRQHPAHRPGLQEGGGLFRGL